MNFIFYKNMCGMIYYCFSGLLFFVNLLGLCVDSQCVGWMFEYYIFMVDFVGSIVYQCVGDSCSGCNCYCCCIYYGMVKFIY